MKNNSTLFPKCGKNELPYYGEIRENARILEEFFFIFFYVPYVSSFFYVPYLSSVFYVPSVFVCSTCLNF